MRAESEKYSLDMEGFKKLRERFAEGETCERKPASQKIYLFAMTTECIKFFELDETRPDEKELSELAQNGLEIRVFDEKREAKWFRASIDKKEFGFRLLDDDISKKDSLHIWDESQYLDIDDKRTGKSIKNGEIQKGIVFATGGGKYPLPLERYEDAKIKADNCPGEDKDTDKYKYAKIKMRNYLGEDPDTGELYVEDWRLTGLVEGIEERGKGGDA